MLESHTLQMCTDSQASKTYMNKKHVTSVRRSPLFGYTLPPAMHPLDFESPPGQHARLAIASETSLRDPPSWNNVERKRCLL